MEIFYNILTFIAGLGTFLLAVRLISKSMQALAGNSLKQKLQKLSKNRFSGLGVGALSTIMLQSATAVTVLVVSLIQAGVITFAQSFAIILGINIGSGIVISTLLFGSIKLGAIFASFAGVGALMMTLSRKETPRHIGQAILGFGVLFLSLGIMTDCMSYFNTLAGFEQFMSAIDTPVFLVLLGILFCTLVQSSLASNAVILSLCGGLGVAGVIDIQSALWLAIGVRISPSISVFMASLGSSIDAKKASVFYLIINAVSGFVFILLYFTGWTYWLESVIQDPAVILVVYNILMTLVGSLIMLPFSNQCAKIMSKMFKTKNKSNVFEMDNATLHMVGSAIVQYGVQSERLINDCVNVIKNVYEFNFKKSKIKLVETLEKKLATLEDNCIQMESNIIKSMGDMAEADKRQLLYYHVIADRIKSLTHRTSKMLEVAQRANPKESFSKEQLNKLDELYDIAMQIASIAKASIQSINQQQPVNDSLIFDIVDLDEKMVKEKLNIRKSLNNEKRLINLDAYARIVNELEQIGEQFASICLAYGDGLKEEKDEETVNEV